MKKNTISVVAFGLLLSTIAGLTATPAEACGNNNNSNRNQTRQIRRMLQQQARLNQFSQFNNPYYTQVNPGLYNVGYNPYAYGNQFYGNQSLYGNPYYNNYNYNSGLLGNGLIGGGLQRVLGTLF